MFFFVIDALKVLKNEKNVQKNISTSVDFTIPDNTATTLNKDGSSCVDPDEAIQLDFVPEGPKVPETETQYKWFFGEEKFGFYVNIFKECLAAIREEWAGRTATLHAAELLAHCALLQPHEFVGTEFVHLFKNAKLFHGENTLWRKFEATKRLKSLFEHNFGRTKKKNNLFFICHSILLKNSRMIPKMIRTGFLPKNV